MSDVDRKARQAEYELQVTAEAHSTMRTKSLEDAIRKAAAGDHPGAINDLLVAHAIDRLRQAMNGPINDRTMERGAALARDATGKH